MPKKIMSVLMSVSVAFVAAACAQSGGGTSTPAASKPSIEIQVAHMFAESHPVHQGLAEGDKWLQEQTDGRIKMRFYMSGTYGEQQNSIQAVRMGQLDVFENGPLPEFYEPAGALFAPFAFRSYEHWDQFKKSDVAANLLKEAGEAMGMKILGFHQFGFRNAVTTERPAKTPEEFQGLKMRMVNVVPYSEVATVLNTVGTPIPITDVYMSLKTGVVEGTENPLAQIYTENFHEVSKYLILTNHMLATSAYLLSEKFWDSLSPEDQKLVEAAFDYAGDRTDEIVKASEADYLQKLKDGGLTVIEPDREKFQARAPLVINKYPAWKEVFDAIQAIE